MQETGLAATFSAGALAVRTGCAATSAPTAGLAAGVDTGHWAGYRSLDRADPDMLCSDLGTLGMHPVLERSLPCLTYKTCLTSRSREHQIK